MPEVNYYGRTNHIFTTNLSWYFLTLYVSRSELVILSALFHKNKNKNTTKFYINRLKWFMVRTFSYYIEYVVALYFCI